MTTASFDRWGQRHIGSATSKSTITCSQNFPLISQSLEDAGLVSWTQAYSKNDIWQQNYTICSSKLKLTAALLALYCQLFHALKTKIQQKEEREKLIVIFWLLWRTTNHILFKWSDCLTLSFWPSKKSLHLLPDSVCLGTEVTGSKEDWGCQPPLLKKYLEPERSGDKRVKMVSQLSPKKKEALLAGMFSRILLEDWEHASTQFCSCYWDSMEEWNRNHLRTRVFADQNRNWVFQRTAHATITRQFY